LESSIVDLEQGLAGVRQALQQGESAEALDAAVAILMAAVNRSRQITQVLTPQQSELISPFRQRLRLALADLQAQREAIARASAVADRAALILFPAGDAAYDAQGHGSRSRVSGSTSA
jgi:hypothetical protein